MKDQVWTVGTLTVNNPDKVTFLIEDGRDGEIVVLEAKKASELVRVQDDQEHWWAGLKETF